MDNSIDQQFIEFIVRSLVGNPDAVQIERRIDEKGVLLELTVDPEDLGRVIGKRGATAQSLRTLLRALGTKNDARYNLKIIDTGEGPNGYNASHDSPAADTPTSVAPAPAADSDDGSSSEDISGMAASSGVTSPLDDDLDENDTSHDDKNVKESDVVARTRRELADLDDLDV